MLSIGIRELRQRASEYLRRVEAGETIQVTDRGRPVALLVPTPRGDAVERLEAEGRLSGVDGDLLDLGEPLAAVQGVPAPSELLDALRDHER